jgi:hypothetical protein
VALIPLWLAYLWARPKIVGAGGFGACRDFFLASYNSTLFTAEHADAIIKSAKAVFWINLAPARGTILE